MIDNDNKKTLNFSLVATETKKIPQLIEKEGRRGYVLYGEDNLYPNYLYDLYSHSSLFQAISKTIVNYVLGSEIVNKTGINYINRFGDTLEELLFKLVKDYTIYGGFTFQVIRNRNGEIAELNYIDFRYARTNEDEDKVYINKDWLKTRVQPIVYERFQFGTKQPVSVFYYKGKETSGVYPIPMYLGAITSLEIHSQISQFHLNNLLNGFSNNVIINFNNGDNLAEDVMDEIEQGVYDKFCGTENTGRFLLSFNADQDHKTTFETVPDDGNDKKYEQLYNTTIQDIMQSFRINKLLLGVDNENTGFSKSAYLESFALYNKTVIRPIQTELIDTLEKLFGKGCIEIKPFVVDWSEEDTGSEAVIDDSINNVQ